MEDTTTNQIAPKLSNKVAGLLKLEPLIGLNPNDQEALVQLVDSAYQKCRLYGMEGESEEGLKLLAMAINQWGIDFDDADWVKEILCDDFQSCDERISDLYLYQSFKTIGPQSVDFSTYTILKFKSRYPETDYENEDIHIAANMALKIGNDYKIDDLLNVYSCVEIILFTGLDFIKDPTCSPIKEFFIDKQLSPSEKLKKSFVWLNENLSKIVEMQDS